MTSLTTVPKRRMAHPTRRTALSDFSKRLTPSEVATLWFRRSADFAKHIHEEYPTFPSPGPDGIYLLSQVEQWFDRFHGVRQSGKDAIAAEEDEAMRAALGIR